MDVCPDVWDVVEPALGTVQHGTASPSHPCSGLLVLAVAPSWSSVGDVGTLQKLDLIQYVLKIHFLLQFLLKWVLDQNLVPAQTGSDVTNAPWLLPLQV